METNENRPLFDKAMVDAGINGACEFFTTTGLNIMEVWYVCRCIMASTEAVMAPALRDILEGIVNKNADTGATLE